jgi:hypothetical protein
MLGLCLSPYEHEPARLRRVDLQRLIVRRRCNAEGVSARPQNRRRRTPPKTATPFDPVGRDNSPNILIERIVIASL